MERLAVEILHRDERAAVLLADLERLDHVRVIEARREPRFVHQHRAERWIVGEIAAQTLDDEELLKPDRSGQRREKDVRHPPGAEPRDEAILGEARPARARGRLRVDSLRFGHTTSMRSFR